MPSERLVLRPPERGHKILITEAGLRVPDDPIIPLARAEQSRNLLKSLGYPAEWHKYAMPHSVCPEELADISTWLGKVLGP